MANSMFRYYYPRHMFPWFNSKGSEFCYGLK